MSDVEPVTTVEGPGGETPPATEPEPEAAEETEAAEPTTIAERVNEAQEANSSEVPEGSGFSADEGPVPVGTGMATSTLGAQAVVAAAAEGEYDELEDVELAPQVEAAVEALTEEHDPEAEDEEEAEPES